MRQSRDGFAVVNEQLRAALSRRAVLKTLAWSGAGLAAFHAMPFGTVPLVYAQQPRRGGTIKIGSFTNIDTLDPHNTTNIAATAIHNNIYSGILKITYHSEDHL